MKTKEILTRLEKEYPEVLKADGFDDAILGVAKGCFGARDGGAYHHAVICYNYNKCVEILVDQGNSEKDAREYLQFNILGTYVGPFTPVFLSDWRSE